MTASPVQRRDADGVRVQDQPLRHPGQWNAADYSGSGSSR